MKWRDLSRGARLFVVTLPSGQTLLASSIVAVHLAEADESALSALGRARRVIIDYRLGDAFSNSIIETVDVDDVFALVTEAHRTHAKAVTP